VVHGGCRGVVRPMFVLLQRSFIGLGCSIAGHLGDLIPRVLVLRLRLCDFARGTDGTTKQQTRETFE
jgi:hypothetical protein